MSEVLTCRTPEIFIYKIIFFIEKFEYDPENGFTGVLSTDKRDFECVGKFNGYSDVQKYDLNRKNYNSKVTILPQNNIEMVQLTVKEYTLRVTKNQSLNLTCYATVGCNDINYNILFHTNSTDKYDVFMNVPDRSKCLNNFNEITNFTKSLVFKSVNSNGTSVKCDIRFGNELKTESPVYYIYFSDEPFVRSDTKNYLLVDYSGITESSSSLRVDIYFEASDKVKIDFYFGDDLLDLSDEQTKYYFNCLSSGIFRQECFLNIDPYTKADTGDYSAKIYLESNPDVKIQLDFTLILPSKFYFILFL